MTTGRDFPPSTTASNPLTANHAGRAGSVLAFPYLTQGSRDLGVSLTLQPVVDLIDGGTSSHRVHRTLRHQGGERMLQAAGRAPLLDDDLRRIDLQTLRTLSVPNTAKGRLIVPVFWKTVSTTPGRFSILRALQTLAEPRTLELEIVELPIGVQTSRLTEVIAHLQTSQQALTLHVPPDRSVVTQGAEAGCLSLTLDLAAVDTERPGGWREADELLRAACRAVPDLLVLNLPAFRVDGARAAGAARGIVPAAPARFPVTH